MYMFSIDRRQGSTNSDEHARPKKKKTITKKKRRAPSPSPSASDPDDEDYVVEEEDDIAPRLSVGQSKPGTRRALCLKSVVPQCPWSMVVAYPWSFPSA